MFHWNKIKQKMNKKYPTLISEDLDQFCAKHNLDPNLKSLFQIILSQFMLNYSKGGPYIAGGALRRWVQGEKYENFKADVDFFFTDGIQLNEVKPNLVKNYSLSLVKKSAYQETYKGPEDQFEYQFIHHPSAWVDDKSKFLHRFDFKHSQFLTDGVNIFYFQDSLKDAKDKVNNILHIRSPKLILKRLLKFTAEGYTTSDEQLDYIYTTFREKTFSDNALNYE